MKQIRCNCKRNLKNCFSLSLLTQVSAKKSVAPKGLIMSMLIFLLILILCLKIALCILLNFLTRLRDTTLESLTENKLDCNHVDGTGDAWRISDESCTYLKHQVYWNHCLKASSLLAQFHVWLNPFNVTHINYAIAKDAGV